MTPKFVKHSLISSLFLVQAIAYTAPPALAGTNYPQRPITIVVPFPAGGTPDILARELAEKASTNLKQPLIVENRSGAGGNIGVQHVARSKADGYTLVMCAYSCAVSPSLYKPSPYNIDTDFTPIVLVGTVPSVLVTNPSVPAKDPNSFINYAKANPGKLNAASSGIGGSAHLALELLKREAQVDIAHIPYRGAGLVMGDLLGGQVDMYFDNLPASLLNIKAGTLNAIAIASESRAQAIPEVPTFAEAGYPKMLINPWFGLLAPAGTPDKAIQTLNAAFNQALQSPEVAQRLDALGVDLAGGSPIELADFLKQETAVIQQLITENNISTTE